MIRSRNEDLVRVVVFGLGLLKRIADGAVLERIFKMPKVGFELLEAVQAAGLILQGLFTEALTQDTASGREAGEGADANFGLEMTIVTTARNNEQGYALLKKFGFPFTKLI